MRPMTYERAGSLDEAKATYTPGSAFLGGGTTLLDLMKLDVMRPARLVDIRSALPSAIAATEQSLSLGAGVKMAQAARHPAILRDYPVIADALRLAASAQIRNMATLGGNVLQRTRCAYFRDASVAACNKRRPGSGCAAMTGINRMHAVLGTSETCIATYAGDLAQALIALDASVDVSGPAGSRTLPFAELHVRPGRDASIETVLQPGEMIVSFHVPASAAARRSLYLKVRDRESYAYALASAAVALDLDGDQVRDARIALGGVATVPWRAREAEAILRGASLTEDRAEEAAEAAVAGAVTSEHNSYKVPLARRTLVRALMQAARMETRR